MGRQSRTELTKVGALLLVPVTHQGYQKFHKIIHLTLQQFALVSKNHENIFPGIYFQGL